MAIPANEKNKGRPSSKGGIEKTARATKDSMIDSATANRIFISLLFLITFAFFGDILLGNGSRILSKEGTDLANEFYYYRSFGFSRLKEGELLLWNPHLFSGSPFLGDFQTAMFYPFNWHYLFMTTPRAINWGIALHILLGALFMYAWTRNRGARPAACFSAGVIFMFCGPHFMHVYAGHLSILCSMIWAPLIFLSIDRLANRFEWKGVLIGIAAVAMQILAGHPQYVFYTGIAAGFYALLTGIIKKRPLILARLAIIYFGGVALSAVQLLTSLEAGMESIRSVSLSFDFVSMFSFPPENLVTLVSPGFFGITPKVDYWGRCYLWEMSVFIGVCGAFLAGYGLLRGEKKLRNFEATMAIVFFLLALGSHTPLLKILYHALPGFSAFRGNSKFTFIVCLFLIMSAAAGFDRILKKDKPSWNMILGLAGVSLIGVVFALTLRFVDASESWRRLLQAISNTGESYLSPDVYSNPAFIRSSRIVASTSVGIAAITGLILAGCLYVARVRQWGRYLPVILIAGEMILFAAFMRVDFNASSLEILGQEDLRAYSFGDDRTLNRYSNNMAMDLNLFDIWGVGPNIPKRYSEFIAFSQDEDPDAPTQGMRIRYDSPMLRLIRFRHVIENRDGRAVAREISPIRTPRFSLVSQYKTFSSRDDMFQAMDAEDFAPMQTVFLESHPDPAPSGVPVKGEVRLIRETTDSIELEAELSTPAILLITDNYSKGWKVKSLREKDARTYKILPAYYALRAVPLDAGNHHLLMEYRSTGFVSGKWISIVSLIMYLALVVIVCRQSIKIRIEPS